MYVCQNGALKSRLTLFVLLYKGIFGRHNLRLDAQITVQEMGKPARNVTRTTFGPWDVNPNANSAWRFPITVTVYSWDGQAITFQVPTDRTPRIIDTGKQFAEPAAVGPTCSACSRPWTNNGFIIQHNT